MLNLEVKNLVSTPRTMEPPISTTGVPAVNMIVRNVFSHMFLPWFLERRPGSSCGDKMATEATPYTIWSDN